MSKDTGKRRRFRTRAKNRALRRIERFEEKLWTLMCRPLSRRIFGDLRLADIVQVIPLSEIAERGFSNSSEQPTEPQQ